MSYKSPITVFSQEKFREIREKQEELVLESILKIGVDVDKDELIKALAYDRDQYRMGYEDGLKANGYRWVSVEDGLPTKEGLYLVYTRKGFIDVDFFHISKDKDVSGYWWQSDLYVTHWMPFPEKPKM